MLPTWTTWTFALAGAICAAGPAIIHLLNRSRHRTVPWAAMEFLQEAVRRSRKMLRLRDFLLLALRTAAVLLFGLALARPYWKSGAGALDVAQPLHVVLLIDNSMSMAYQALGASGLDRAKQRAREFVDQLPHGSRISIVPLCGMPGGYRADPFSATVDALRMLDRIPVVDRRCDLAMSLAAAKKTKDSLPDLAVRVVFFTDGQVSNFQNFRSPDDLGDVPEMQIVSVEPELTENTWISSFRLQDSVADVETPATFAVELRHQGTHPRESVPVTLSIDGQPVASKTVSLRPGSAVREVLFQHTFAAVLRKEGQPLYVAVSVSIPPDRLTMDDARHLSVPVISALPVVFVDQFGREQEDRLYARYGETRHLRRLLVPIARGDEPERQLVEIRHVSIDQVEVSLLRDARLVVMAGLHDPGAKTELLRQFVEQGGQLVIAAGADFDPIAWTEQAWLDGLGVLPAPLESEFVGSLPTAAGDQITPFFLSYDSMKQHEYFRLAGVGEKELADLYSEPFFFRAVGVDVSDRVLENLAAMERDRLRESLRFRSDTDANATLDHWLTWATQEDSGEESVQSDAITSQAIKQRVQETMPQVLARFDNGQPYLVQRRIGLGRVCFAASGVLSNWNTLPKTNAILIFDRILRSMISDTLPRRNLRVGPAITLPLQDDDPRVSYFLRRPNELAEREYLERGFVGPLRRGLVIRDVFQRGIYRIYRESGDEKETADPEEADSILAVNAEETQPLSESELTPMTREEFSQLASDTSLRWVDEGQAISLAGSQIRGADTWWYLALFVFMCLLTEMGVLFWLG